MKKIINKKLFSLVMLLVVLFSSLFSIMSNNVVNGAITGTGKYTDVMEDLQTDSSFNVENYPVESGDYAPQVIGISESDDNELFVYVYHPTGDEYKIYASSINISLELHNQIDVNNYGLTHLSSNGVFSKYLVNNLTIKSSQMVRYYEIVSIFRDFDENIDEKPNNDNTIDEIAYNVGKLYTVNTLSGKTLYSVVDVETIEITGYKVGLLRYEGKGPVYTTDEDIDSHYVVFDVAFDIDKLYEADVSYVYQTYRASWDQFGLSEKEEWGEPTQAKVQLNYKQKFEESYNTLFWKRTFKWDRIEKVEDFIKNENLTEETTESIKNMQYVLRFAETKFSTSTSGSWNYHDRTFVTEVTIMRLKYEVDGKTYNMGVVCNKQSDDGIPDNYFDGGEWELRDGVEWILFILLLFLLYIILSPFIPLIFAVGSAIIRILWSIIKRILKTAINIIISILTFPFNMKGGKY